MCHVYVMLSLLFLWITIGTLFRNVAAFYESKPLEAQLASEIMERLTDDNMTEALHTMRPVPDASTRLRVHVDFHLRRILSVDETRETLTVLFDTYLEWEDHHLSWQPRDYRGMRSIKIPKRHIFVPDIINLDALSSHSPYSSAPEQYVEVKFDGTVSLFQPVVYTLSCELDMSYFPFDSHQCSTSWGSWFFDRKSLSLEKSRDEELNLGSYTPDLQWNVTETKIYLDFTTSSGARFHVLVLEFTLERQSGMYVSLFVIPSVLYSMLILFMFCLPLNGPERTNLGMIIITGVTIMIFFLGGFIGTSSKLRLSSFFNLLLFMTSIAITTSCFLQMIYKKKTRMRKWIRKIFVEKIGKWLRIHEKCVAEVQEETNIKKAEFCKAPECYVTNMSKTPNQSSTSVFKCQSPSVRIDGESNGMNSSTADDSQHSAAAHSFHSGQYDSNITDAHSCYPPSFMDYSHVISYANHRDTPVLNSAFNSTYTSVHAMSRAADTCDFPKSTVDIIEPHGVLDRNSVHISADFASTKSEEGSSNVNLNASSENDSPFKSSVPVPRSVSGYVEDPPDGYRRTSTSQPRRKSFAEVDSKVKARSRALSKVYNDTQLQSRASMSKGTDRTRAKSVASVGKRVARLSDPAIMGVRLVGTQQLASLLTERTTSARQASVSTYDADLYGQGSNTQQFDMLESVMPRARSKSLSARGSLVPDLSKPSSIPDVFSMKGSRPADVAHREFMSTIPRLPPLHQTKTTRRQSFTADGAYEIDELLIIEEEPGGALQKLRLSSKNRMSRASISGSRKSAPKTTPEVEEKGRKEAIEQQNRRRIASQDWRVIAVLVNYFLLVIFAVAVLLVLVLFFPFAPPPKVTEEDLYIN